MTTKKKQKHTRSKQDSYEQFIRDLRFTQIGLESCSCQVDQLKYFAQRENKKMRRRVSSNYQVKLVTDEWFDATANFKLTVQGEKASTPALTIECDFVAHFHGKEPINKALAERFTSAQLRAYIWPYFRQFVSDLTARMAIPPIVIPLMLGD